MDANIALMTIGALAALLGSLLAQLFLPYIQSQKMKEDRRLDRLEEAALYLEQLKLGRIRRFEDKQYLEFVRCLLYLDDETRSRVIGLYGLAQDYDKKKEAVVDMAAKLQEEIARKLR